MLFFSSRKKRVVVSSLLSFRLSSPLYFCIPTFTVKDCKEAWFSGEENIENVYKFWNNTKNRKNHANVKIRNLFLKKKDDVFQCERDVHSIGEPLPEPHSANPHPAGAHRHHYGQGDQEQAQDQHCKR